MVTFGLNYDVKPECVEQFENITKEALQLMKTLPGHTDTRLYRDVHRPNSYLIYSAWETKEHFAAFMRSDAFKQVQTAGRDMLTHPPRHSVYTRDQMN